MPKCDSADMKNRTVTSERLNVCMLCTLHSFSYFILNPYSYCTFQCRTVVYAEVEEVWLFVAADVSRPFGSTTNVLIQA